MTWYRKNYGSWLDPQNVPNIMPRNQTEAIFLNYLQFHDKCISERCSFDESEIFKFLCAKGNYPIPGSDAEFHNLGQLFIQYGPQYFIDNTDVKGKTKQELAYLRTKPWVEYTCVTDNENSKYCVTSTDGPIQNVSKQSPG